jgi:hypothetical protein
MSLTLIAPHRFTNGSAGRLPVFFLCGDPNKIPEILPTAPLEFRVALGVLAREIGEGAGSWRCARAAQHKRAVLRRVLASLRQPMLTPRRPRSRDRRKSLVSQCAHEDDFHP